MSLTKASSPIHQSILLASCATAFASLIGPALRQTGVISHLPDSIADADAIRDSPVAHPFGVPGSLLGLASLATTFGLALAAEESKTAAKILGGKLAADAAIAAYDLTLEAVTFKRVSIWTLATAAATGVMVYAGRKQVLESLRILAHDATVLVDTI